MSAISDLLPAEARQHGAPTRDQLDGPTRTGRGGPSEGDAPPQ